MRKAASLCLASLFALTTLPSYAEECGKWLSTTHVKNLVAPVDLAIENLMQMSESLGKEAKSTLDSQSFQQFDKIITEDGIATSIITSANTAKQYLDEALTLTLIKGLMVHPKDKATVESFLSINAVGALKSSRASQNRINQLLTRVTRPGLAAESTKLRDNLADISRSLGKCTNPPSK